MTWYALRDVLCRAISCMFMESIGEECSMILQCNNDNRIPAIHNTAHIRPISSSGYTLL